MLLLLNAGSTLRRTYDLYSQLANPDSTALKPNNDRLNVTNNLRIIPGTLGHVEMGVKYLFDTPVYWQLPKRFTGDQVSVGTRGQRHVPVF